MKLTFGSVCSGIEAASLAWAKPLGWSPAFFSEIEPYPCELLAHHYPDVPNHGDMTTYESWPDANLDVLCGGTPCQSYSVAGLRAGLDDPRGDLMLTFGAIARRYRPRWLVWENVPGVLSANKGRDFGTFLGLLGQLGYGFAYRVLDAQHAGVPQRRRRVFVVGCLGSWQCAAAVLFERHSLQGHPPPSREARQDSAAAAEGRARSRGDIHPDIAATLDAGYGRLQGASGQDANHGHSTLVAYGTNNLSGPIEVSGALMAHASPRLDFESDTFIAHTLRGDGFDASEDGSGRGTPLIPVMAFDSTQITSKTNGSSPRPGDPCHTLASGAKAPAIAFDSRQECVSSEAVFGALGSSSPQAQAIAFSHDVSPTLMAGSTNPASHGKKNGTDREALVAHGMRVRRLMPIECERLQGIPDGYTAIPRKGGKVAADGPRYKAIGNSWAVPCVTWIGRRIEAVESVMQEVADRA